MPNLENTISTCNFVFIPVLFIPSTMYAQALAIVALTSFLTPTSTQGLSLPNTYSYHFSNPQTVLSFQGIYGSNFNETITFCNFHPKPFERDIWNIIPVIAQSTDSGQIEYNEKGALLYGGVYQAPNNSIVWKGFGFSANGPYDTAFALGPKGLQADGYYTFLDQKNESTPGGETGPWILYYERDPTNEECALVYREHECKKWRIMP